MTSPISGPTFCLRTLTLAALSVVATAQTSPQNDTVCAVWNKEMKGAALALHATSNTETTLMVLRQDVSALSNKMEFCEDEPSAHRCLGIVSTVNAIYRQIIDATTFAGQAQKRYNDVSSSQPSNCSKV